MHACLVGLLDVLLPDVDFVLYLDLDIVLVADVALLWGAFRDFLPQEVFAHSVVPLVPRTVPLVPFWYP